MDGLQWKTLSKWMIWGYHYFRKHPYTKLAKLNPCKDICKPRFNPEMPMAAFSAPKNQGEARPPSR